MDRIGASNEIESLTLAIYKKKSKYLAMSYIAAMNIHAFHINYSHSNYVVKINSF